MTVELRFNGSQWIDPQDLWAALESADVSATSPDINGQANGRPSYEIKQSTNPLKPIVVRINHPPGDVTQSSRDAIKAAMPVAFVSEVER